MDAKNAVVSFKVHAQPHLPSQKAVEKFELLHPKLISRLNLLFPNFMVKEKV